jgi:H+/Cl- antiporter ClcA
MLFKNKTIISFSQKVEQISVMLFLAKWLFFALLIGFFTGCASAFFLVSLEWLTQWRENHLWIIVLLPLGGFLIGLAYHYFGKEVVKGNNLLLDEFYTPTQVIPFKMAPLVLFGTLITHFFGGSAGREGTAVQMGGAIADQFTHLFKLKQQDRKIIICMGISAGFASVFGTPIAGTIFALEVFMIGKIRYEALLPCLFSAFIANYTCHAWEIAHTSYSIAFVPPMNLQNFGWTIFVGVICGLTALVFAKSTHFFTDLFKNNIKYPPLRPLLGGIVIAVAIWVLGTTKYVGLGIPTIVEAFEKPLNSYDFLLKIVFTSFTLGAGFKGGEVTPLFYIGATLGNALAWFVPLPVALLAGMCFVAVFSGASNTPIACTFMGLELFGVDGAMYIFTACVLAYFFSGHKGIYGSQRIGVAKHSSEETAIKLNS